MRVTVGLWLVSQGHWNEALVKYDERLERNPQDGEAVAGKLKCLDALGRWEEVSERLVE